MTNIGALKIVEKRKKGKPKEHLIFVADGMVTGSHSKLDDNQKLFRVGNHLMMGTGGSEPVFETARQLQGVQFKTAEELAKTILDISTKFGLTQKDYQNFIIGGPDTEGLQIYHINTTGFRFGPNGKPDPKAKLKDRGFTKRNYDFDGSGSRFVTSYIDGIHEAGKGIFAKDVADGLVLAYEFGKKGSKDTGVNDKLQFGIISASGVSRLYPRSANALSEEAAIEYIKEMTGIVHKNPKKWANFEEMRDVSVAFQEVSDILGNVYHSLDCDLETFAKTRLSFTSNAEAWANDNVTRKQLRFAKDIRTQAKQNVMKGANALVTRGLDALLGYQHDFEARQHEKEDRVRAYQKK